MSRILSRSFWIALASAVSLSTAWAADDPAGALTAEGKVSVTGEASTFTLSDQEYAYFSGDRVETSDTSRAVIRLNDGLNVAFAESSSGQISRDGDTWVIDLESGHAGVSAAEGIDYRITHDGEVISSGEPLKTDGEPFLASVDGGDVRFYMPAQLDDDDDTGGVLLSWKEAAAIAALITGGVIIADDDGPSS